MNRKLLASLAVLLGLLIGFGAYWWVTSDLGERPPVTPPARTGAGEPTPPPPAASTASTPPTGPAPVRTDVVPEPRTTPTVALPPQGLRGLVLDADQRPLRDVEVHLIESAANDPLALPLQQQHRRAIGPLASVRSSDDGTFAIGLPVVQDKTYDLFLVAKGYAVAHRGGLRLLAGQWHELGAITLLPGAVLRGQVTVAGHADIPVPDATVRVDVGTAFDDAALRSLPDGEGSLGATVDAAGHYEVANVPMRGTVRVSAVAPGFARAVRTDIELRADAPVVVDFALSPGLGIRGRVVAADGLAVANARVEALPMEMAGEALAGTSDAYGHFEVLGLVKGRYRLRVLAVGYELEERPGIVAGTEDLTVALTPRTTVRVAVRTPEGAVLRSYQLGLRRYFDDHGGQVGLVVDVPDLRVRLDAATDRATVANVPTGRFVFQVEAEGYAKTMSAPFACGRRDDALAEPVLEVTMHVGGALRGTVVDELGVPLAGASVKTLPAGADPDNPLFKIVEGTLADRITSLQVLTGNDGTFVLPQLAHGDYQLALDHPNACRSTVGGVHVEQDGAQDLGQIRLPIGAEVTGHATVGGRVAGQLKIVLTSIPPTGTTTPPPAPTPSLRLETVTDANGLFTLPRRVPPGTYQMQAAVAGAGEPEGQIFRQLLQLQRSATTVVVLPGQRRLERDIDLATDR